MNPPDKMKQDLLQKTIHRLNGAADNLNISSAQVAGLSLFFDKLLLWNKSINLSGATQFFQLCQEHLPDSIMLAQKCPQNGSIIDIGSGGGLPALPFAHLRRDCEITLLEPRNKRIAFLRTARQLLPEPQKPKMKIVHGRVNLSPEVTLPCNCDGPYSVAISRATFEPLKWLDIGLSILNGGGTLFFFLNRLEPDLDAKVSACKRALDFECFSYETDSGAKRVLAKLTVHKAKA